MTAASRSNRLLVIYKRSAYQLYVVEQRDRRLRQLLRARHPLTLEMLAAHKVHERAMRHVITTLDRLHLPYDLVYRAHLKGPPRHRLVLPVGGDGTFLQAAHHVLDDTPLLGVNSDPLRSEAVFCGATPETLEAMLQRALMDDLPEMRLQRLQAALNDRPLGPLVVNDVLVAHPDPAIMSRYRLRIGHVEDDQKSSGLWVATAAGSTSAVLAAGGTRLPWTDTRLQYRPRELYCGRLTRCRLTGGVLTDRTKVRATWLTREGAVFIDGAHVRHPLRFADVLSVQPARRPLRVLGLTARAPQPAAAC